MTIDKKNTPKSQSTGAKGKSHHVTKTTGGKQHVTASKIAGGHYNIVGGHYKIAGGYAKTTGGDVPTTPKMSSGASKPSSLEGKFKNIGDLSNIVDLAMKGVTVELFYTFASIIDMPDKYLAEILNTTARTLSNYKEQGKPLEPVKGEHLLKLIELFKKGEDVFGTLSEFQYWLSKPKMGSKKIPLQLLVTPGGVDLISQELDRVAWGYAY